MSENKSGERAEDERVRTMVAKRRGREGGMMVRRDDGKEGRMRRWRGKGERLTTRGKWMIGEDEWEKAMGCEKAGVD